MAVKFLSKARPEAKSVAVSPKTPSFKKPAIDSPYKQVAPKRVSPAISSPKSGHRYAGMVMVVQDDLDQLTSPATRALTRDFQHRKNAALRKRTP